MLVSEILEYFWSYVVMDKAAVAAAAAVVFRDQLVQQQVQLGFEARVVRTLQRF